MEGINQTSTDLPRKLLLGELVEVRQKEMGLRGSWHLGTVVKVKWGRRVVEYDDLLASDGSTKLRESIPLQRDVLLTSPTMRNGVSRIGTLTKPNKRGFIRPRPPPCSTPPPSWKRGLLVDAFYNDAWWEGILLDDMQSSHVKSTVKVFFPEEGDLQQISVNDLRVSQEWDEDSGHWVVCGYWSFGSENGQIDIEALRQISTTRRSFLKEMWRQRRCDGSLSSEMKDQTGLHRSVTVLTYPEHNRYGEKTVEEKRVAFDTDMVSLKESGTDELVCEDPLTRSCQSLGYVTPLQAGLCLDNRHFKLIQAQGEHGTDYFSNRRVLLDCNGEEEKLSLCPRFVSATSQKTKKRKLTKENRASSRATRSNLSCFTEDSDKPLTRLYNVNRGGLEHTTENPSLTQEGKQLPSDPKDTGVESLKCSFSPKASIKQTRLAIKQYLLDAGWKFYARHRAHGLATKQEFVYESPSGSRFSSLAAACRGWEACLTNGNFSAGSMAKELKLLNAYHMAQAVKFRRKSTMQQAKVDEMVSTNGSPSTPLSNRTVLEMLNSSVPTQQTGEPASVLANSQSSKEMKGSQNNSNQGAEKPLKRKGTAHDGCPHVEDKRKRGRLPLMKGSTSPLEESEGPRVRGGVRMQVLLSLPAKRAETGSFNDMGDCSHLKKSTVLSWLMDRGVLKENEPVSYINRKDGNVMKTGHVTREGVVCDCCKDVFTLSNFEAHAGSKLHRPSANTFLDDGRSISDCQLEACALQDVKEKEGPMEVNDETCSVCGDGGEVVLCDRCPSAFHSNCIGLEVIPEGDWYCPRCSCGICGSNQAEAHGQDNTMLHCDQCEVEYHFSCAHGTVIHGTKTWFCNAQCRQIFVALRFLVGIVNPLENGFSWTLLRSMKKDEGLSPSSLEDMAEHHSKLSVAHGVMQECFAPIIDPRTNTNLISQALYNRRSKVSRLNYCGFYTIILERGDEIISVATIRVHGDKLAEMPLVGTRFQYRRQGMCRRLMQALEGVLMRMGVEKLILPAVPELLETWVGAFGFQHVSPQGTRELSKVSLMTFPGTTLLEKPLNGAAAPVLRSICLPIVSESPSCQSVEDFFTMARASLDGDVMGFGENTDGLHHNFLAAPHMPNQNQELLSSVTSGDLLSALAARAAKGYLNMPSKVGQVQNRNRSKELPRSSSEALPMHKVPDKEDDLHTKVVIATTRSNRLVRSRRWVADGLRQLKHATKQSKRTFATPTASCTETAEYLECCSLVETFAQMNDHYQGNRCCLENVYVRTKRKGTAVSREGIQGNADGIAEGRSCTEICTRQSGANNHCAIAMGDENTSFLICDGNLRPDETRLGDSSDDGPSSSNSRDELSVCPKFYTRRKKTENMHKSLNSESFFLGSVQEIKECSFQVPLTCDSYECLMPDLGMMEVSLAS